MIKKFFYPLFLSFYALTCSGQEGAFSSAASWLASPLDIRGAGMGGLGVATGADANSMFGNPARVAYSTDYAEFAMTYTPIASQIVKGINLLTLSGFTNSDQHYFGGAIQYFTLGDVDILDDNGNQMQLVRPSQKALSAFYARQFSESLSLGVTVKGVFSSAAAGMQYEGGMAKKGFALATDFGITGQVPAGNNYVNYGLSFNNIGTKMGYSGSLKSFLPMSMKAGGGYKFLLDEENYIYTGLEMQKSLLPEAGSDPDISTLSAIGSSFKSGYGFAIGTEAALANMVFLRLGYSKQPQGIGNNSFVSLGLGVYSFFSDSRVRFDAAFLLPPASNLAMANTFKIGIALAFVDRY